MKTTPAGALSVTAVPRLKPPQRRLAHRIRLWLDVWSERRSLAMLDDRALADLGLTPADVRRETARPLFDVPTCR